MKDKLYKRILFALLALGVVLTVAHFIYAACEYQTSSIIHYVSKEWW